MNKINSLYQYASYSPIEIKRQNKKSVRASNVLFTSTGSLKQANPLFLSLDAKAKIASAMLSFKGFKPDNPLISTLNYNNDSEALTKTPVRKKANIVISRHQVDETSVFYEFTNVHYLESQLNGLRTNSTLQVKFDIDKENKLVKFSEELNEPITPMVIYAAISESIKNGFNGKIQWDFKNTDLLKQALSYGLETKDEKLMKAIKTDDDSYIQSCLYENIFEDKSFSFFLPVNNVNAIQEKITEEFKNRMNDVPVFPILQRGKFIPIKALETVSIGKNADITLENIQSNLPDKMAKFRINNDKTAYLANISGNDKAITVNGVSLHNDEKALVKPYDIIKLDNELYIYTGEGIRLISSDASKIETLYPLGIKDLVFSQGSVGDCYLCASLLGLSMHPEGQEILAKLIDNPSEDNYTVNFPGFPEEKIEVDTSDEVFKYNGIKSKNTGVRILEQAFGQLKKRLNWSLKETKDNAPIEEWLWYGFPSNTLYVLTGGEQIYFDSKGNTTALRYVEDYNDSFKNIAKTNPEVIQQVEKYLKNLAEHFDDNIITIISDKDAESKDMFFKDGTKVVQNHAYVVKEIDTKNRQLAILNPHQTWMPAIVISYDEFLENFRRIEGVKLPFRS